jgi:sphingomyelin phosphodiesterase acid-like 3
MGRVLLRWKISLACGTALLAGLNASSLMAQNPAPVATKTSAKTAPDHSIHALLVSDIHFDPFWDPAKVTQLVAEPASHWRGILSSPASSDRDAQFAALEQKCPTRGEDTPYNLYASSLQAMRTTAADAKFITVSGDLIAHAFSCKFNAVVPESEPGVYQAFVAKAIEYVLLELRTALPEARVYAALGNNDSDCGDYKQDEHGLFLSQLADTFSKDFPPAVRQSIALTFGDAGYYSAPLPAPLHTRLLVLDDTFMSPKFTACSGSPDTGGAKAQIEWLRQQLSAARENREHVWVMGHIPPGVDPYTTAAKMRNVCGGSAPETFLSSEDLPDLLARYGDVIQLAIFAHTHMDEMRLLKPEHPTESEPHGGVAVKLVPSISPINGNTPSFTVATIAPNAMLEDYRVYAAPEDAGDAGPWKEEYDFDQAYQQKAFSASALAALTAGFASDTGGTTSASEAYLRNYFVRDRSAELRLFWPEYVCAMFNDGADAYRHCRCTAPNR